MRRKNGLPKTKPQEREEQRRALCFWRQGARSFLRASRFRIRISASFPPDFQQIIPSIDFVEAGRVVRAAWLTLFCLIGLGIVVVVRLSFGTSPAAVSAAMIHSAPSVATAAQAAQQDAFRKADRLPVFHAEVAPGNGPEVASVAPAPPFSAAPPKIVGRHWHDPNAIATTHQTPVHRSTHGRRGKQDSDASVVQRNRCQRAMPCSKPSSSHKAATIQWLQKSNRATP